MVMPTFQVLREASVHSSEQLIRVCGQLDAASAKALRAPLRSAAEAGARVVLLDLSECSFVDSTGLAAILNGARDLKMAGAALVAVTSNSQIVRLFELTAIGETVRFSPLGTVRLPSWTGSPSAGRTDPTADALPGGRLLVSPRRFL